MAGYTDDEKSVYVALICQSMRDGLTARKACIAIGVNFSTFRYWCGENEEYAARYAQAREALYEHWEEDVIDISDEQQEGSIERSTPQGTTIETRDMLEHRKLRVQTRQWLLSKLKPKRYGDKMQLGGADDLPPMRTKADVTINPEDAYKEMLGIGNGRS